MLRCELRPGRHLAGWLVAVLIGGIACGGCGGSGDKTRQQPKSIDKVGYVTGFGAFGRESYAWVARDKGFFREQGIEVDIQLGAAGDANLKLLAADKVQFAVIDYAGAVVRAGNGQFANFRCVAALTQQTLIAIMTLAGNGIASPRDLAGKTIAQATGAVPKTLFGPYARLAGVDPGAVKWLEVGPQQLLPLLNAGKVAAIGQFVPALPAVQKAAAGRQVIVFPYRDYMADLYGNVLTTSKTLAEQKPDLVRRFATALDRGLRYAMDHPQEAGEILHKAAPTMDAATAAAELRVMQPYVGQAAAGAPAGAFDPARVAASIALVQRFGLIRQSIPPEQVVNFDVLRSATPAHS
jgi:NitT/TauT family transport system substrate-binding protein